MGAAQSDVLALGVRVVDGWSGPLKDFVTNLRKAHDANKVVNKEGAAFTKAHNLAFMDLKKNIEETSGRIKNMLQPALVGLGILGTSGIIYGISKAIRSVSNSARDLKFLRTETGLTVNQLRVWHQAMEEVGGDAASFDAATRGFAQNLKQANIGRGKFFEEQAKAPNEGMRQFWVQLNKIKDTEEALEFVRNKARSMPEGIQKRQLIEMTGLPAEIGRVTKERFDAIHKDIGDLSESAQKNLEVLDEAFNKLSRSVLHLKETIGVGLADAVSNLVNRFSDFINDNGPDLTKVLNAISDGLKNTDWDSYGRGIGTVTGAIKRLVGAFGGLNTLITGAAWLLGGAPAAVGAASGRLITPAIGAGAEKLKKSGIANSLDRFQGESFTDWMVRISHLPGGAEALKNSGQISRQRQSLAAHIWRPGASLQVQHVLSLGNMGLRLLSR